MAKQTLPFAGGIGAAALLSFVLSPWSGSGAGSSTPTSQPSTSSEASAKESASLATTYSLSRNDLGPWSAICSVFSTSDPEDSESSVNHPYRPEAGLELHPPPGLSNDMAAGQIKEETVTEGPNQQRTQTQKKFVPQYHYKANLGSCIPDKASDHLELKSFIATVPDPLGSHLALQFDRSVVAIEKAAANRGYTFERYWFPWSGILQMGHSAHADENIAAQRQQLKEQPGVMIFRKTEKNGAPDAYSGRLLVFLVGETPTAGINKIAFSKAVRYTSQLQCKLADSPACQAMNAQDNSTEMGSCARPLPVSILGPSFSASFSPIYRTLYDLARSPSRGVCVFADVLSPTATVQAIRDKFRDEMKQEHLGTFHPLAPDDEATERSMVGYLALLGYERSEIAYLNEDETPYNPGAPCAKEDRDCIERKKAEAPIPILTYPRDLSALRNTWQPTALTITPADIAGDAIKTSIVPLSLHEQITNELDSPPDFAAEQSASEIDQALRNIVTVIRHRRYRVIIITASNALDEIYLMQYLHEIAPDIRIATYDQDMLMLRAAQFGDLVGTVSSTSFPLLNAGAIRGAPDVSMEGFPNSSSMATFLGAKTLIDSGQPPIIGPGVYVQGNDGFWPAQSDSSGSTFTRTSMKVPWVWYVITSGFLGLVALHWMKYGAIYLPHSQGSSWSMRFGIGGARRKEDLLEDYYLLVGNNQLFILSFVLLLPPLLWLLEPTERSWPLAAWFCSILLSTTALLVLSGLLLARMRNTISKVSEPEDPVIVRRADLVAVVIYPIITIVAYAVMVLKQGGETFAVASRFMYIFDGLSPLPVITSVVLVWYMLAVMGLRAVKTMKTMRVCPPINCNKLIGKRGSWTEALDEAQSRLLGALEPIVRFDGATTAIFLVGYAIVCALHGWPALRGVDYRAFRFWAFVCGLCMLALTVILQFYRLWESWRRLKQMLNILAVSPLRSGFQAISEDFLAAKLWTPINRHLFIALQEKTYSAMLGLMKDAPLSARACLASAASEAEELLSRLKYWVAEGGIVRQSQTNDLQTSLNMPFRMTDPLASAWFRDGCSRGEAPFVSYVALRYVALIRYVNAQMRFLLTWVLAAYVFLIIGFKTYPFEGQHTIGSILTIIFSLLFVASAYVFVEMDQDELLSMLDGTTPGKTNYLDALLRFATVGGIPLIAVVASQFPTVEHFLLSWVKPTVESLH